MILNCQIPVKYTIEYKMYLMNCLSTNEPNTIGLEY